MKRVWACPVATEKRLTYIGLGAEIDNIDISIAVPAGVLAGRDEAELALSYPALVIPEGVRCQCGSRGLVKAR